MFKKTILIIGAAGNMGYEGLKGINTPGPVLDPEPPKVVLFRPKGQGILPFVLCTLFKNGTNKLVRSTRSFENKFLDQVVSSVH